MRIVAISQVYLPDPTGVFLADLANHWADQGQEVTVLTASPAQPGTLSRCVTRIRYDRRSVRRRAASKIAFGAGAWSAFARSAFDRPIDVLLFVGTSWLARGIPRRSAPRRLHWVQDVYPDALLALRATPATRLAARAARVVLDDAWAAADKIVVLSDAMRLRLIGRVGADIVSTIRLWPMNDWPARHDQALELRRARGIDADAFVVLHHGNLGLAYDLEPMLRAADRLRYEKGVVFAIVGRGAQRAAIERRIREDNLKNVRLFDPVPAAQLTDSLAMGDVHFLGTRADWDGISFPSKLVASLAIARPCIVTSSQTGEVSRLLQRAACGMTADPNGQAVAEAILALRADRVRRMEMGQRARVLCDAAFSRVASLNAWDDLLRRVSRA